MAATNAESIPTAQTNGVIEDGYDDDDKTKLRPVDIDAVSIPNMANICGICGKTSPTCSIVAPESSQKLLSLVNFG